MCFVWLPEQTVIMRLSLHNVNWRRFTNQKNSVYWAVRAESLNVNTAYNKLYIPILAHKLYRINYPQTETLLQITAINCHPQGDVNKKNVFYGATSPVGPEPLHCLVFTITFRNKVLCRTPLGEWSAVEENSTLLNTKHTTVGQPCPWRNSSPKTELSRCCMPTPQTSRPMGSTNTKKYIILMHEPAIYNVKNIYATILKILNLIFFFGGSYKFFDLYT